MHDPHYRANPVNRCFFCKANLYAAMQRECGDGEAHDHPAGERDGQRVAGGTGTTEARAVHHRNGHERLRQRRYAEEQDQAVTAIFR